MLQQTLETERITLVPLADGHLEWEVELDSDPEVMRYLSGRASTREEVDASHARVDVLWGTWSDLLSYQLPELA